MEKTNRWWDFYYVRYFVGAISGTVFLLFALHHNAFIWHQLIEPFEPEPFPHLPALAIRVFNGGALAVIEIATALATLGLAYCYLASAPILLLHGLRDMFGSRASTYQHIGSITQALTAVGVVMAAVSFVPHTAQTRWPLFTGHWFRFFPYLIIVLSQIIMLCRFSPDRFRTGYTTLATQRSNQNQAEYIESYRHLREHGNALLIIMMEAILSLAIGGAPSLLSCGLLVFVWILPATFAWFLGTWLERLLMP